MFESLLLAEGVHFGRFDVAEIDSLCTDGLGQVAPDVLSALHDEITLLSPQLGACVAVYGRFGQKYKGIAEIVDVDVIPSRFAFSNDRRVVLR